MQGKTQDSVEDYAYDLLRCWANRPITTDQEVQIILVHLFDFLKAKDEKKFYAMFDEGKK